MEIMIASGYGALALFMLGWLVKISYFNGRIQNKIKTIEESAKQLPCQEMHGKITEIDKKVEAMHVDIKWIKKTLNNKK